MAFQLKVRYCEAFVHLFSVEVEAHVGISYVAICLFFLSMVSKTPAAELVALLYFKTHKSPLVPVTMKDLYFKRQNHKLHFQRLFL